MMLLQRHVELLITLEDVLGAGVECQVGHFPLEVLGQLIELRLSLLPTGGNDGDRPFRADQRRQGVTHRRSASAAGRAA